MFSVQCVGDEEYRAGNKYEVVGGGSGTGGGNGVLDIAECQAIYTHVSGCGLKVGDGEAARDGRLGEVN